MNDNNCSRSGLKGHTRHRGLTASGAQVYDLVKEQIGTLRLMPLRKRHVRFPLLQSFLLSWHRKGTIRLMPHILQGLSHGKETICHISCKACPI
eukprot:1140853-Pelagomonas_calceolata.AAC.9